MVTFVAISKLRRVWSRRSTRRTIVSFLVIFLVAAAATSAENRPSAPVISDDLDRASLQLAISRSISYLRALPAEQVVGQKPRKVTARQVLDNLETFQRLLDRWNCMECLVTEIKSRFDVVPSSSIADESEILFTGYYQPILEGSLVPTAEYRYPIYRRPDDLTAAEVVTLIPETAKDRVFGRVEGEQFMPYFSRYQIDELGVLRGRGYEIAWLKDPIELFFLHIQGSGILRLPDGQQLYIGYAGQNGRPYRSIGRLLIDTGKIPQQEMSMQRLRRYLAEHPVERSDILNYNESYVFFRINSDGPLGSLNLPLTAGRSVAMDSSLFPKASLALIYTEIPVLDASGQLIGWRPTVRFVLNQDTGGAIRGMRRTDLFMGTGDFAGALAGYMNSPGKVYFILLKDRTTATGTVR